MNRRAEAAIAARIVREEAPPNPSALETFMGVPLDEFTLEELRDIIRFMGRQTDPNVGRPS